MNKSFETKTSRGLARIAAFCASTTTSAAVVLVMNMGPASATTVEAFLIAGQTAPTNDSAPPFTVEGTGVYRLDLNATQVATSANLIGGLDFFVENALTYKTSDGPNTPAINSGETGASPIAARVNSEVGTWDDVGIVVDGGSDAAENVDFGNGSFVTFNGLQDGFTDLIIAEDGGLDPFKLELCNSSGCSTVFNGFSDTLKSELGGLSLFSLIDTSTPGNMDQAFLFRFSDKIFDDVKISETANYGGALLEVDFVGTGTVAPIPVPAGLPLILTGLGAFVWVRRRRSQS